MHLPDSTAVPHSSPLPDSNPIIDLIEAFPRSKAMFAAVSLGVFDLLERKPE
jgi:acetylserotonin N-methyltransferase